MSTITPANSEPISQIRVSPNGRYFVDGDGMPVFWLGDTQGELFRLFHADEALRILKHRQDQGFNVILIMLTGVDLRHLEKDYKTPYANVEGEEPWIDNDPLRPNEKYFQHIDTMIRLGDQTGQTLVVGVYHQWHVDIITLEKARRWARWVANRYRDVPNLIWCMYPRATEAYIPVCRELAAGLQEGDAGAHLISVHPDPSVASSSFMHDESWLAFNMIQTCIDYDKIDEAVTADYHHTPVKPVVMAEGGYEGVEFGKLQTPHDIRKQAYWTHLAGGYHVYGHNDCWKAPLRWTEWIDAPGAQHLHVFRDVATSCREWWNLIPDPSLIVSGRGDGYALNLAARSASGDWILAYLSEPSTVSLRLDAITTAERISAQWIDPRTGARTPAGSFPTANVVSFTTPPGWEDAALLAEARG
jgi:hypothetical protein